ncbi:ALQxL family class IV lanthipeptide [Crossiella sp. NPDC003009]
MISVEFDVNALQALEENETELSLWPCRITI